MSRRLPRPEAGVTVAPGARRAAALLAVAALASFAACKPPPRAPAPAPKVGVAKPVVRDVVEWDEFTGRLEAVDSVEVRARVSGFLESVKFKEGAMVRKGDLLIIVDPRPYEAVLRRAEADLALAKARKDLADTRYERASRLVAKNAMSKEEADTRAAESRQAAAAVQAAQAAVEAARLDVEFTHVHAPVSGRVSRKFVTEGNLINGGSGSQGTLLTTIVSLDPIQVYFEADERSFLKYVRLARQGLRPSSREVKSPVQIAFADEQGFPHQGYVDFVDNRLDPSTGTMSARAVLANPDLALSPGLFARVRLVGSGQYRAVMIPDEAVGHDQSRTFVFVLDDQNQAQMRTIATGPMIDGLRVVREGLSGDERIVVSGLQRVRPGIAVEATEREIPASPPATPPTAAPMEGAR